MADWLSGAGNAAAGLGGLFSSFGNLRLQKKNLAYQKQIQQQIFDREDNAVQRRSADLEAAGLSKTLAAGGAAQAGAVVKTTAPQLEGFGEHAAKIAQAPKAFLEAQASKRAISKTVAEEEAIRKNLELMDTQIAGKKLENDFMAKSNPMKLQEDSIALMYSEQLKQEQLNKLIRENTKLDSDTALQDVNARLKSSQITESQLQIIRQRLENDFFKNKTVPLAEKELLAKQLALELADTLLEGNTWNLEWYKDKGMPIGSSLNPLQQATGQISNVISGMFRGNK